MNELLTDTLSPKELAMALGVSESSIKRWVDSGLITVYRTAGGHRRIPRNDAIRFARQKGLRIARADILGLPGLEAVERSDTLDGDLLYRLLTSQKSDHARNFIHAAYLSGVSLAELFDGPVVAAMKRIGEEWLSGKQGIYIEHRATAAVEDIISQLGTLQPEPLQILPLALGGAPPNDPHTIPSQMVASMFREHRWRTTNLGPRTPLYSFVDATQEEKPSLVWLALKTELKDDQVSGVVALCSRLLEANVLPVLGGSEAVAHEGKWPGGIRLVNSMTELDQIIADLTPVDAS
ncbi:MAG: helix-turn-helix domain-containing protein [Rhodothermales bacterium]|nr:helix-turn-helix domain-containing protein [Rhodothermales bacterium]